MLLDRVLAAEIARVHQSKLHNLKSPSGRIVRRPTSAPAAMRMRMISV